MEKELDIIIPAYNAHDKIRKTLHSIASQSIKDIIQVSICNDAGKNYHDIIKEFEKDIDIQEFDLESNKGPGVARQLGIDNTKCEFFTFIDSDDVFGDPFSVEMLLNTIKFSNNDVVISRFIQQVVNENNEQLFLNYERDSIWMHGKIYRRSYIQENNIRFLPYIRANEDGYFNSIALHKTANIEYTDIVTYYWLHYSDSITNTNYYEVKGYRDWYKMMIEVIKEFERCIKDGKYEETITTDVLNYTIANCITVGFLEYNAFLNMYPAKLCEEFISYINEFYQTIFKDWYKKPEARGFCEASFADGLKNNHRVFDTIPSLGFEDFLNLLEEKVAN